MNDDGTMARLPDLVAFAQKHNLKLGTIADLIAYRRRTERLVKRVQEGLFDHVAGGEWKLIVYANTVEYQEHLALVKGDLSGPEPVLVRMHAVDLLDDMTGGPHWISIHNAMHMIGREGRGVMVLIREHRPTALSDRVRQLVAVAAAAAGVARLRDRRADPARSRREGHGAAVEPAAHRDRAGGLRAEHRGDAADPGHGDGGGTKDEYRRRGAARGAADRRARRRTC